MRFIVEFSTRTPTRRMAQACRINRPGPSWGLRMAGDGRRISPGCWDSNGRIGQLERWCRRRGVLPTGVPTVRSEAKSDAKGARRLSLLPGRRGNFCESWIPRRLSEALHGRFSSSSTPFQAIVFHRSSSSFLFFALLASSSSTSPAPLFSSPIPSDDKGQRGGEGQPRGATKGDGEGRR